MAEIIASEGLEWVFDHYRQLQPQYPNRWVLVYKCQVVGSIADWNELEPLRTELKRKGVIREGAPAIQWICPVGEESSFFPRIIVRHDMQRPVAEVQTSLPGSTRGLAGLKKLLLAVVFDDSDWLFEHYEELQEKYPDRWVVIFGRRVLATAEHDNGFVDREKALQKLEGEGIPRHVTTVEFVDRKGAEHPRRAFCAVAA